MKNWCGETAIVSDCLRKEGGKEEGEGKEENRLQARIREGKTKGRKE